MGHGALRRVSGVDPLQQFRETLPGDHACRFVLRDRDSVFSQELDWVVASSE